VKLSSIIICCMAFVLSSCSLIDPPEKIPTFIQIDDINLVVNASLEGSASEKITDAWIYVADQLVGIFELPCKVPVLIEGDREIKVYAGIKDNGISDLRVKYPFYTYYSETIDFVPGETIILNPTVNYVSTVTFWIEDFEDPGVKFNRQVTSDTSLVAIQSPAINVFEGASSGMAYLESSDIYFEVVTDETTFNTFPQGGSPVYLELNYKTNVPVNIGVYATVGTAIQHLHMTINPSNEDINLAEWNKIYINLTDRVSSEINATEFDIYIGYFNTGGSAQDPQAYFDNIKVLY